MNTFNREGWLTELASRVRVHFSGLTLSPFRLTCGWPSKCGLSTNRRRVGECHGAKYSKDGTHEIFISPVLDDPLEVAGTVMHELCHVAAGIETAHGKDFIKVCRHVGLTKGKPACVMPGPSLEDTLKGYLKDMPDYPHRALVTPARVAVRPPQNLRLVCRNPACGCVIMMSGKWFLAAGLPVCGCGELFRTGKDG